MAFIHKPLDLGYEDLTCETRSTGRKYVAPDGKDYPSVTTVLSHLGEDGIRAWRARVGEEEANKVSTRASKRGTSVHTMLRILSSITMSTRKVYSSRSYKAQ